MNSKRTNYFEHAYTWYNYDMKNLETSLLAVLNGLKIDEENFNNIRAFVYSKTRLSTYKLRFENEIDYIYVINRALQLMKIEEKIHDTGFTEYRISRPPYYDIYTK